MVDLRVVSLVALKVALTVGLRDRLKVGRLVALLAVLMAG